MPQDPRLRFRFYLSGKLIHEQWVNSEDDDAEAQSINIAKMHAQLGLSADERNELHYSEIYDPDMPEEQAYTRVGTDKDAMENPIEFNQDFVDKL